MSTESLVTVRMRVMFLPSPSFLLIAHGSCCERNKDEYNDVFICTVETLQPFIALKWCPFGTCMYVCVNHLTDKLIPRTRFTDRNLA